MASLNSIKTVIKRMSSISDVGKHICFFGGAIPYIYHNQDSGREHSDIDILVDQDYMEEIRQLLKDNNLYEENLDSVNLGLDMDYGLKTVIDGVYVEFLPMSINNGILIRRDFSPTKKAVGVEAIPFTQLSDLIITFDIDGIKTYCQSPEMIKAAKEQYKREKDLADINFIERHGVDVEKYNRVKKALELATSFVISYEDLMKNKKGL